MKFFAIIALTCAIGLMLFNPTSRQRLRARIRQAPAGAIQQTFNVDGVERTALVFPNSKPAPAPGAPLLLCFHGHGGRVEGTARRWDYQSLWPEAVVVYLQGLPGVVGIVDPEGKQPGWQKNPGEQNDRDVKFVDVALEELQRKYRIDPKRVYAAGHSNGARFAMVLWNMRGEKFAAFCSAAAQGGLMIRDAVPRSLFALAGEKDPLVPYDGQVRAIEVARAVLKADPSKAVTKGYAKLEPGVNGTELATYLHPGGHEFSKEAMPLVVEFFKRQVRK
jgi:polyhydroxybutyrate depolymerase